MNHYETLGVPRDASAHDIKRAFRRAARDHHPDRNGGDTEKMAAVNRAWEVLGDPQRRAHYDATGLDQEPPGIEAEAQRVVPQVFSSALHHEDILGAARESVREGKAQLDRQREDAQMGLRRIEKQSGVVRLKKAGGENLVQQLIDARRAELNTVLEKAARGDLIHARVLELLDAYESDYVAPQPAQEYDAWTRRTATFSGTFR